MVLGYTLDPDVVRQWSERCRLYRRRTGWLWLVALAALAMPVALVAVVGAAAFLPACIAFVVGMLVIGVVLSKQTALLFCPHCGQRPTVYSQRGQSPLRATFCNRCEYWLKEPL